MEKVQIAQIANEAAAAALGIADITELDGKSWSDIGKQVLDSSADKAFIEALCDRIGKTRGFDRVYTGHFASIMREGYEYGSVLRYLDAELKNAEDNPTWDIEEGVSHDPFRLSFIKVMSTYYNKKQTAQIRSSIGREQMKEAFLSEGEMMSFIEFLNIWLENSVTYHKETRARALVCSAIGEVIHSAFPSGDYTGTSIRAVNLVKVYNTAHPTAPITKDAFLHSDEAIREAVYQIGLTSDNMSEFCTDFNMTGAQRFTPSGKLNLYMNSAFERAARVFLYDAKGQFNTENLKLVTTENIPFWQAHDENFSFDECTRVKVKTSDGTQVDIKGVVAFMFDKDALMIANDNPRSYTDFNSEDETYTQKVKLDVSQYINVSQNMVIFYLADEEVSA